MHVEHCELLIIGGGPAGLVAAREAAYQARQASIILLERDGQVESRVSCGEVKEALARYDDTFQDQLASSAQYFV